MIYKVTKGKKSNNNFLNVKKMIFSGGGGTPPQREKLQTLTLPKSCDINRDYLFQPEKNDFIELKPKILQRVFIFSLEGK